MQCSAIAIGLVLALAPAARAGKPSVAEAKKAARAWLDAMELGPADDPPAPPTLAAVALTATPFYAVAYDLSPDEPLCAATTATDAAAVAKLLACLRGSVQSDGTLGPWTTKSRKDLSGPISQLDNKVDELARTATLVNLELPCAGTYNQVVIAVVKDKAKDAVPKVAAVLSQHGACGE